MPSAREPPTSPQAIPKDQFYPQSASVLGPAVARQPASSPRPSPLRPNEGSAAEFRSGGKSIHVNPGVSNPYEPPSPLAHKRSVERLISAFRPSDTSPLKGRGDQPLPEVCRTHLQTELQELRNTLEKKQAQHEVIGAMAQAKSLVVDEQCIAQQVQQVQHVASEALEYEVKELCATVSSQQAEQAIFLQMLTGEIDDLKKQVKDSSKAGSPHSSPSLDSFVPEIDDLRNTVTSHQQWKSLQEKTFQSMRSEINALTLGLETLQQEMRAIQDVTAINKSAADLDMKQLRVEVDSKISQQQVQLKSWDVDIQSFKALAAQQQGSNGLADDVEKLMHLVSDWKSQHGSMIATMDSEVKTLRYELQGKEGQATGDAENQLLSICNSLQEHHKEEMEALQRSQQEMELKMKKQEDDYVQAMKRSTDLSLEMRSDMNYLRDFLEKSNIAQQGTDCPQEAIQMFLTLSAEVANLRQKHEDIQAIASNNDLMSASQLQAELKDLHSASEAQRSEVDDVLQQLLDQKKQLGALGAASKAVANVSEAENRAMRRSFEEQLLQQAEAIRLLSAQMIRVTDNLPTQPLPVPDPPALAQDGDVTSIKHDIDTLKLQTTLQRSLQATEVAKEAVAIQNQLHKVVGSERDARVQESTEMRALIKNLYKDMAELTQSLAPQPTERTKRAFGTYPTELLEPLEIKRLVTTDPILGSGSPDVVDCSGGETPFSAVFDRN